MRESAPKSPEENVRYSSKNPGPGPGYPTLSEDPDDSYLRNLTEELREMNEERDAREKLLQQERAAYPPALPSYGPRRTLAQMREDAGEIVQDPQGNPVGPAALVPTDVADSLDFPIRLPTNPGHIKAIEATGGTVDERGTLVHTIRMQRRKAADGVASRGSVFAIAAKPGAPTQYLARQGAKVGGTQRIEGWTRFRSPLIVDGPPGGAGFNSAMKQLGLYPEISFEAVSEAAAAARVAGQANPEVRVQALKDVVTRFGGEPDLIEPLLAVRGLEATESEWAIRENILSALARKNDYDGVIAILEQDAYTLEKIQAHPSYQAVAAKLAEAQQVKLAALDKFDLLKADGMDYGDREYRDAWGQYQTEVRRVNAVIEEMGTVDQQIRKDERIFRLSELADVREKLNPTPGKDSPEYLAAQNAHAELSRQAALADVKADALERNFYRAQKGVGGVSFSDWLVTHPNAEDAIREAKRTAEELRQKFLRSSDQILRVPRNVGPPGFTLRDDLPAWRGPAA